MISSLLKKILSGDPNKRVLDSLQKQVASVNLLEAEFEKKGADELCALTNEWKKTLAQKSATEQERYLEDILPYAFAAVREAAKRTLHQRHYDVQIVGALTLHQGAIAEMKTGEGKTIVATMPAYLNALLGRGVHIVTVNDYLARRDTSWMGQIYHFLGLKVACLQQLGSALYYDESVETETEVFLEQPGVHAFKVDMEHLRQCTRKEAYQADITYGTNSEFGFDYLRDNMVHALDQKVQRGHFYAIIDEVDSILIDEARTPLIISAPNAQAQDLYKKFASLMPLLKEHAHYSVDEERHAVSLTEEGIKKMEALLGVHNIYTEDVTLAHQLDQALKANALYKKDKDYVIKDGEVLIVDQFTGRLMHGRRYSQGLHQAIEAKENVEVKQESRTLATITIQNYFRMYKKLSGMTGTAATEAEEFYKIYGLDVTQIPSNKPVVRLDKQDVIYKTERGKFRALIERIKEKQECGQPVLVGTISIEKNEVLSNLLKEAGISHEVLNAKNHEREAQIIAQAGRKGAVTVATNMAGRGVDIVLGGNPPQEAEATEVKRFGGLCVFGSERHEARRIDNQLRGRSGRQGDPGESQFFISLEDDLMRIFGSQRVKSVMDRLGLPEDTPIENRFISRSIEKAQQRVEGYNFDIRKHLVEYDDVINKQRESIYAWRDKILTFVEGGAFAESMESNILEMVKNEITRIVESNITEHAVDIKEIKKALADIPLIAEETDMRNNQEKEKMIEELYAHARERYAELSKAVHPEIKANIERTLLLRTIDMLWIDHLDAIDHLRAGIGLRGYGQRDPLVEYKGEAYMMHRLLLQEIEKRVVYNIYKIFIAYDERYESLDVLAKTGKAIEEQKEIKPEMRFSPKGGEESSPYAGVRHQDNTGDAYVPKDRNPHSGVKIGRNDPCWCGTGKKYKRCHGK